MCFHLLVVVGLLSGAPHAPSDVESCENAGARTPREHLRVCAALFAEPACRRAFIPSDQPMSVPLLHEMAAACAPTTCPRLDGKHREEPFCRGARGTQASRQVERELLARLKARRAELEQARAKLPGPIATHSANAARLVEELTRLEGRARKLVEAKLNTETQKLEAVEQQLAEAERVLERVESAERETRGVIAALQDFKEVWEMMTPENRGRMLRALVDRVEVDRRSGRAEIHLVDFAADPEGVGAAKAAGIGDAGDGVGEGE